MSDLEKLGIDIHSIEPNDDFMGELNKAIKTLQEETLKNRFEVILNKNLIKVRKIETNYRTILGCRISCKCLDKNIAFIVKPDNKPTYGQLEDKINKYKEVMDKVLNIIDECKLLMPHEFDWGEQIEQIEKLLKEVE